MYSLTGQKCGTVYFKTETGSIKQESVSRSSNVTSNPIEGGFEINDHVFRQPIKFKLSGIAIGGDSVFKRLNEMWYSNDVLTYSGINRIENLVITSLSHTFTSKNKDGCEVSIDLQKINVVSSDYVEDDDDVSMAAQDQGKGGSESKTKNDGFKTPSKQSASSESYQNYVDKYLDKNGKSESELKSETPFFTGAN